MARPLSDHPEVQEAWMLGFEDGFRAATRIAGLNLADEIEAHLRAILEEGETDENGDDPNN